MSIYDWLKALDARLGRGPDNNIEGGRRRRCAQTLSAVHAWQRADFPPNGLSAEMRTRFATEVAIQQQWAGKRRWDRVLLVSCPCGEVPTRAELLKFIEQERQVAADVLAVQAQRRRLEALYVGEPERGLRRRPWMKSTRKAGSRS